MVGKVIEKIDYSHLNLEFGLKAPLVRLSNSEVIIHLKRALPLIDISKQQLKLITCMVQACQTAKGEEMIESFANISPFAGLSVTSIRVHAKALVKKGLLNELYCTTDPKNKRRGMLYDIAVPDFALSPDNITEESKSKIQIKLEDVDLVPSNELADFPFSDLVTSVLFGALRFSQKGKESKINSVVIWGSERIQVETTSGKGERIAQIKDLRYYISTITILESIVRDRIINNEEIGETFNISLNAILSIIKKTKTGQNKDQALKAIRRLSGTTFHINKLPNWFLSKYKMAENSKLHLNIFTLRVEGESREVSGSVVLQLQFPAETIAQIRRRFSDTKAMHDLTEINTIALLATNNLAFAFNLWSSAYFYMRGLAVIDWTEMRDRTAPQFTLTEFKKAFSIVLKKHAVPATIASDIGVEEIDESFESKYLNNIAITETSCLYGIKIALDNGEFVLMPDIQSNSIQVKNLVFPLHQRPPFI